MPCTLHANTLCPTLHPNTLHPTPKYFTPHILHPNILQTTLYNPHPLYTRILCTPHITPHTLHPNTVHLMPYTQTLYTSQPTPHTLHPITSHPILYTQTFYIPHLTAKHCTPYTQTNTLHPTPKHFTPHTDLFPFPASDPSPARQHLEPQPRHEGEGGLLAAGGEVAADEGLHAVGHALVRDAVVQLQAVRDHGLLVAAAAQLLLLVHRLLPVNLLHLRVKGFRLLPLLPFCHGWRAP